MFYIMIYLFVITVLSTIFISLVRIVPRAASDTPSRSGESSSINLFAARLAANVTGSSPVATTD
jgi:hypothetical protein